MNRQILRISGFSLLTGAVVFILHIVLRSVMTAGSDPATYTREGSWLLISALGILGAVLVLLGLPALYARTATRLGTAGLIGMVLLAVAWLFIGLFLSLYSALIMPWLADRASALIAASEPLPTAFVIAFAIVLLAWLVGSVLFAAPFLRKQASPQWVGYTLVASGVWMIVGNLVIAPSGPASNLAINLLSNLAPVFWLIGMGYLGYRMVSEHHLPLPKTTA